VSQTGVKFNRFFDNLPRLVLQRVAHIIVVIAVYFAGIMMVLLSTVTNLSNLSQIFEFLLPFSFNFLDQTLNLLIGFVLLGLARGLYSKVKRAYVPTLFVLVFGIVNTISRTRSLRLMVVYCLILLAVLFARKEFYREKFVYSWGAIIFDVALFGTLLVAYAVAGFHSGQWWNANLMGGQFVLFPSDDVWISGMIGLGVGALTLLSLQQYLTRSSETLGDSFDQMRFEKLLTRYGGTKSSQRLELSGYHYYYYQVNGQDRVVFGYQIKSNRCFILGEPIGDKTLWQQATQAFMVAADNLGYQLAFYKISEKFVVQLHDLGFQFAKIGETGTANLGTADYLQQEVYRKLSVQGYTFKKYETLPAELLPQLAAVSNAWLNGKGEKYFGNGRFETDYILKSPVAVARNNENQIVGFITQQAISPNWVSYDLLRILPEAPKELANFLVLGMLASWEQAGFKKVDLGMVPLAQVGAGPFAFFEERIMNIIYRYGNAIYNFQDNFSGKQKYVTHWEGCYFAYLKGSNFYLAAAQLLRLIGRGKNKGPTLVEEVILEE
ncbi:MAG: phosphatidylglycerol lysyltransferase domain-containing protein, partial [Enterococcus sp.]